MCLMVLKTHGEDLDTAGLLTSLAYTIYEKFPRACRPLFDQLLASISGLSHKLLTELANKFELSGEAVTAPGVVGAVEKYKKETFKKLVQPIVGKSAGQMHKNEIKIRLLEPMHNWPTKRNFNRQSMAAAATALNGHSYADLGICSLFDQNA